MENNPGNLKSSVFGGFKKKDVLSYIFELNESSQEAQQKFAEQIEELSRSRDEFRYGFSELEARAEELSAELNETAKSLNMEQARRQEAEGLVEMLRLEAQKRDAAFKEKERELEAAQAQLKDLAAQRRELADEKAQVELAASQIAGLLSEARADADRMVDDAREEAASILETAQKTAERYPQEAKAAAQAYIADANANVADTYRRFAAFTQLLEQAREGLEAAGQAAKAAGEQAPKNLEQPHAPQHGRPQTAHDAERSRTEAEKKAEDLTREALGRYGVRKDDSGFFRLAVDKK